ncbi:hypothetical protein BDN67DRAFT_1005979 [Paxillus ammoniavirescens]|nr:hypothetical protein BDN67DRAFT_1005979 [Paxillus ammoniavirescens]
MVCRWFQFLPPSTNNDVQNINRCTNGRSPAISLTYAETFAQPAPIADFIWYPGASRHTLSSYCFVATVGECPVKLLDGRDGRLRASYPIVDHRDVAFNLTADKLYCGFEDAIEIFDVQKPGEGDRLQTTPSKKSKDGLKGGVSGLEKGGVTQLLAIFASSTSRCFLPNGVPPSRRTATAHVLFPFLIPSYRLNDSHSPKM